MNARIGGRRVAAPLAAALACGLLLQILGGVVAPAVVQRTAQRQLQAMLRRPVSIDRVSVDPFTATVSLAGVRAAGGDSDAPSLLVDRVVANVELLPSLLRRALVLRELR